MAFRKKPAATIGRSLIASAAQADVTMPNWSMYFGYDTGWQQELWRFYDCVPEFARAASYVGQACSRVRIYVADVNDHGEIQGEVKPGNPVGKLAATVLGGQKKRAELLRLMGTALMVSGEFWILGLNVANSDEDRWFVVQLNELRQLENFFMYPGADPMRQFAYSFGDKEVTLREGRDIIYRVWTPHPSKTIAADSPGRTLQMTLMELEILSQYVLAQARSRLASGGVWPWPAGADFARDDTQPANSETLMQKMLDAAQTNLQNFGSASQLVPIIVELPDDLFDRVKDPIMFGSVLSEQAMKLREEARGRIAGGMDVAPEIVNGMGDSTHWNGPLIEQSTVDTVIVPTMTRICNALTDIYLAPALKLLGKEPKKYCFWFDTAPLVSRPNKLKETLELYEQGLVSADEVLKAADLPESAAMGGDEDLKFYVRKLLLSDTNLLQIPPLRKLAGLNIKDMTPDALPPGAQGQPGIGGRAPAPPPPPRTLSNINPTATPQRSTLPGAPNNAITGPGNNAPALTAAAEARGLLVGADLQVRQALDRVGKSLRSKPGGVAYRDFAADEVYLHIPISDAGYAEALLRKGFGHLGALMDSLNLSEYTTEVHGILSTYCQDLLITQQPHDPKKLYERLHVAGLL